MFHAASIAVSLLSTRHVLLAQMLPPLLGSDTEVSEVRTLRHDAQFVIVVASHSLMVVGNSADRRR